MGAALRAAAIAVFRSLPSFILSSARPRGVALQRVSSSRIAGVGSISSDFGSNRPNAQAVPDGCLARSVPVRSTEIALIVPGNRLGTSALLGSVIILLKFILDFHYSIISCRLNSIFILNDPLIQVTIH